MIALVVAATLLHANPPATPVRTRLRPEIPWVVAVGATPRTDLTAGDDVIRALADVGARLVVKRRPDGSLVIADGPPEAHDAVVAAARALAADGALFVEGRTPLSDTGALRSAGAAIPEATTTGEPLAPSPALGDVEGEALVLWLEDLLGPGAEASISVTRGHARLTLAHVDAAKARDVVTAAVAQPVLPSTVAALRARAAGNVAHRRSTVGVWAEEMGVRWLAFGALDVDDPGDGLAERLRARLFPERLLR